MNPIPVAIYLLLCFVVGYFGRHRTIGFAGNLALSLLVTPFLMALILLISAPKSSPEKSG